MNRLLIYDGPNDKSLLIGELFGTLSEKSFSSSGKSMFIDFKKPFTFLSNTINEFAASIKYKKINSECQSWLDLTNNLIMSPSHPKMNCSWLITGKYGSFIILEFSHIEVLLIKPLNILVIFSLIEICFQIPTYSFKLDLII